jgi:hypothetical protein
MHVSQLVITMKMVEDRFLRNVSSKQQSSSKAVLLRHAGAKGKRWYSSYSFLISALDRGEWSASRPGHSLRRGKNTRYPLDRRLGGPQSWSGHSYPSSETSEATTEAHDIITLKTTADNLRYIICYCLQNITSKIK